MVSTSRSHSERVTANLEAILVRLADRFLNECARGDGARGLGPAAGFKI